MSLSRKPDQAKGMPLNWVSARRSELCVSRPTCIMLADAGPTAKTFGQSVQGVLLSPFVAAVSLAAAVAPGGGKGRETEGGKEKEADVEVAGAASEAAAAEEGAANGGLEHATSAERSVRGQRGGLLGGLMRSASLHQLALLGAGGGSQKQPRARRRERLGGSRSRAQLDRQSSRRSLGGRSRRGRHGGLGSDSGDSDSGEALPACQAA